MRRIRIHVVGSVYNNEELAEMETVAKVFAVEERIIDLTCDIQPEKNDIVSHQIDPKKIIKTEDIYNTNLNILSVRGFN